MKRTYPFAPLAAAMGLPEHQAAKHLGISGSTEKQYRNEGMSELVADRRAAQAGFVAYEIWPEMLEHAIADHDAVEVARKARRREVLTNAMRRYRENHPEVREYDRQRRRAYYAEVGEYERKRERERYARNRDVILARKREQRRLRREEGEAA